MTTVQAARWLGMTGSDAAVTQRVRRAARAAEAGAGRILFPRQSGRLIFTEANMRENLPHFFSKKSEERAAAMALLSAQRRDSEDIRELLGKINSSTDALMGSMQALTDAFRTLLAANER